MENNNLEANFQHIPGWGIDADPRNEPTYPMKNYTGDDHKRLNYQRPPLQSETVEVLHSNERPGLTAVFGTPLPPTGLSGSLRRFAFKFSEDRLGHWLPLIVADRIQMVEGIVEDLQQGRIPNLFQELGLGALWKYNRKGMLLNIAVLTGVVIGLTTVLSWRRAALK